MSAKKKKTVIVFAKPPIPGFAKTRLIPALKAEGAAELHAQLTLRTFENIYNEKTWDVQLWCAGDINHPFFKTCKDKFGSPLYPQVGKNLGDKMFNAFESALKKYDKAVIVGTDCPLLDHKVIEQAFLALDDNDAVINPADDGGYVLLGLKKADKRIFANVDWGTSVVAAQTFENFSLLMLKNKTLPSLWDVDVPEDLSRLKALGYFKL